MPVSNFKIRSFAMVKRLLRHCDLAVEVVDARDIDNTRIRKMEMNYKSKMMIAATKSDLVRGKTGFADKTRDGIRIAFVNTKEHNGTEILLALIRKFADEKRGRIEKKILKRGEDIEIRVVIFGLPNIGKSSIINALAKKRVALTGFRSGITRGEQWINLGKGILLYDTPGVVDFQMRPDQLVMHGGIDAEKLSNPEPAAIEIIRKFRAEKSKSLAKHFGVGMKEDGEEMLSDIALARGLLGKGGVPLVQEAAKVVIREYQKGKFKI